MINNNIKIKLYWKRAQERENSLVWTYVSPCYVSGVSPCPHAVAPCYGSYHEERRLFIQYIRWINAKVNQKDEIVTLDHVQHQDIFLQKIFINNAANYYAHLSQRLKYRQLLHTQRVPDTISTQQWLQGCWRWTMMKSSLIGYIVSPSFTRNKQKKDQTIITSIKIKKQSTSNTITSLQVYKISIHKDSLW